MWTWQKYYHKYNVINKLTNASMHKIICKVTNNAGARTKSVASHKCKY